MDFDHINIPEENNISIEINTYNSNNEYNILFNNFPENNSEVNESKIFDKFIIPNHSIIFSQQFKKESLKAGNLGRKTKRMKCEEKEKKYHNRESQDNMLRKINGHYISFIIGFVNTILDILEFKEQFKNINYKYKIKINKKYFSYLKNRNIGEILNQDISPKLRNQPIDHNKIIFEKLRDNPIIKKLFSQNYLYLFNSVYYKSERNVNLNNYGLNANILLPKKVKMYRDLLEKGDNNQSPEYLRKLNKFVKNKFLYKINN